MNKMRIGKGGCGTLFRNGFLATALAVCFVAGMRGAVSQTNVSHEDHPATHNMLVVGHDSIFLSHLPMFQDMNKTKSAFTSPHRYQVILQAELSQSGKSADQIYVTDRRGNPEVKMYTLGPDDFVLSRLFTPNARPKLNSFKGVVFRGHLERGGKPIDGLTDVSINIKKVVHARMFNPTDAKPDKLTYILFGTGQELFLAHRISEPPDFDQILSIKAEGHEVTAEELDRGVEIVFSDRQNLASERLREGDALSARGLVTGAHQVLDLRIKADAELYFEEGELLTPPTMDQTAEEKKSGF
jgi:hypothetical protein